MNKNIDVEDLVQQTVPKMIKKQIDAIIKMRKDIVAPVDTMGCHMLADRNAEPQIYRFQILVALMLSSQTKDQITAAAMERLKTAGCNINTIIKMDRGHLEELIKPVGFYKRKAEYIQKTAIILRDEFNSDIPDTYKGLCSLPGVGPKMANLALRIAFDKVEGIGVDIHVHRIANRLDWVNTKTPEATELELQELFPRNEWSTINKLLVGFGQTICQAKPLCEECSVNKLCPYYLKQTSNKKRRHQ